MISILCIMSTKDSTSMRNWVTRGSSVPTCTELCQSITTRKSLREYWRSLQKQLSANLKLKDSLSQTVSHPKTLKTSWVLEISYKDTKALNKREPPRNLRESRLSREKLAPSTMLASMCKQRVDLWHWPVKWPKLWNTKWIIKKKFNSLTNSKRMLFRNVFADLMKNPKPRLMSLISGRLRSLEQMVVTNLIEQFKLNFALLT